MDHNPHLKSWAAPTPNKIAGKGQVEIPAEAENIVWQTRAAPPSAYENALGDAIETAFGEGHYDLAPLVARINELGVMSPEGTPWTEDRFKTEMARLGY
ncbi:MAG: recombinase-like helix-turn-helix domain-containing protein [Pseudomonadota bacterium]